MRRSEPPERGEADPGTTKGDRSRGRPLGSQGSPPDSAEQRVELRAMAPRELRHFGLALALHRRTHHLGVALPELLQPQRRVRRRAVELGEAPEHEAVEGVAGEPEVLRCRDRGAGERAVDLALVVDAVLLDLERFNNFAEFRKAFWLAVAAVPELKKEFSPQNRALIEVGKAPWAAATTEDRPAGVSAASPEAAPRGGRTLQPRQHRHCHSGVPRRSVGSRHALW